MKYITPFSCCGGADIISSGSLNGKLIAAGAVPGLAGILVSYLKYAGKDIH